MALFPERRRVPLAASGRGSKAGRGPEVPVQRPSICNAERKAERDAALAEVARLRAELHAVTDQLRAANHRAQQAGMQAARTERRLQAMLAAHPR